MRKHRYAVVGPLGRQNGAGSSSLRHPAQRGRVCAARRCLRSRRRGRLDDLESSLRTEMETLGTDLDCRTTDWASEVVDHGESEFRHIYSDPLNISRAS
jgi:hypothetical protein